jgi:hypothetical protein
VANLVLHPTKPIVVTASDDKTWKMWHLPNGDLIMSGEGHKDWVAGVDFHPKGMCLASGGNTFFGLLAGGVRGNAARCLAVGCLSGVCKEYVVALYTVQSALGSVVHVPPYPRACWHEGCTTRT